MPAVSSFPFIHYHCSTAAGPPCAVQSVTQNARDGSLRVVRKCWFGLQKAFPSDNADHEALLQEAKANRARLFEGGEGGGAPEPTEDEAEPDPEPGPEADMDEPDDAEPTAAEYDEFFNSILAM